MANSNYTHVPTQIAATVVEVESTKSGGNAGYRTRWVTMVPSVPGPPQSLSDYQYYGGSVPVKNTFDFGADIGYIDSCIMCW